ncbi:MAG: aminoacyl-tRNA hydrolase [Candidatus Omnitrophica bacterium]|nr:aminoacyl-tRNA hydrolase [Candidatus Omnitrophota bacterium]
MRLIVGLGNPGMEYADNRHNIGFKVVEKLVGRKLKKLHWRNILTAEKDVGGQECLVGQPLTYMNASGDAVGSLVSHYGIALQDILVVCDDMDLPFGIMRLRPSGSAGGHNGLKSIIAELKTDKFVRLRLGIGRPPARGSVIKHVLENFTAGEKKILPDFINQALSCIHSWVSEGVEKTMNQFNQRNNA